MMNQVERSVSQGLLHLRVLERALHDRRSLWTMSLGGVEVPVHAEITTNGVMFEAEFPEHCWLARPVDLSLMWDGDVVISRSIVPSDAGLAVDWMFTVRTPALAA